MNALVVIPLILIAALCAVTAVLVGSDLVREALDEIEARREWDEIKRLSEARRHLSATQPRSIR